MMNLYEVNTVYQLNLQLSTLSIHEGVKGVTVNIVKASLLEQKGL